jgi:hypothetical protein
MMGKTLKNSFVHFVSFVVKRIFNVPIGAY